MGTPAAVNKQAIRRARQEYRTAASGGKWIYSSDLNGDGGFLSIDGFGSNIA